MSNSKLISKLEMAISQETKTIFDLKMDVAYLEALESTLSEWNSDNDNEAYNDL